MPKVKKTTEITFTADEIKEMLLNHVCTQEQIHYSKDFKVNFKIGGTTGPSYPDDEPVHLVSATVVLC